MDANEGNYKYKGGDTSMNIENVFVRCHEQAKIAEIVEEYWRNPLRLPQPDWGLPSSFHIILDRESNRKIAISPPTGGWIALVESKEVVDFALAGALSRGLGAFVLAIQVSEASGAAGYAVVSNGHLVESQFRQDDEDPLETIREVLKAHNVPFDPIGFGETVHQLKEGWIVKKAR